MKILVLNGGLGGSSGNTSRVLEPLIATLKKEAEVEVISLNEKTPAEATLLAADAFVFATGTYWDSWGSPLQIFLERHTHLEATPTWFGKPAAVVVTMHSVGGKGVLSRLQGVLSTLGLWLPPMSGFCYSLATHLALQHPSEWQDDLWQLADLELIARNLLLAARVPSHWEAWPVDRSDPRRLWMEL